jgi:hypothetical protein
MNVTASGIRLIPGLTMSGAVPPLPPPLIRFLAHPVIVNFVISEAVKESLLSHKRRVELGVTFLGENHGCRMEFTVMGSAVSPVCLRV